MSSHYTSHYGISMNPTALKAWAKSTVKQIVKDCTADGVTPVLLYTGMSGITAATALGLAFPDDFRFVQEYVRKAKEKSHGRRVESGDTAGYDQEVANPRYFIVDDFIASGTTVISMLKLYQIYFLRGIDSNNVYLALSADDAIRKLGGKLGDEVMIKSIGKNNAKIKRIQKARAKAVQAFCKDLF